MSTTVIPALVQQPMAIRVILRGGPADGVEVSVKVLSNWIETPVEQDTGNTGYALHRYERTAACDEWGRAIYESNPAPTLRGYKVLEFLLGMFPTEREVAIEYVGEAEHGEGEHVWDTMYDGDENKIADDFRLYVENRT